MSLRTHTGDDNELVENQWLTQTRAVGAETRTPVDSHGRQQDTCVMWLDRAYVQHLSHEYAHNTGIQSSPCWRSSHDPAGREFGAGPESVWHLGEDGHQLSSR